MIQARDFIHPAKAFGFRTWAGVPCSFLTPLINGVIDDPDLAYIASSNEGDAVATATGAALAGQRTVAMMQNSGLGNAVSPLSSLNWVFRIPVLLIITLRGEPGLPDEPQHELMGQITGRLLDELQIPWAWFPRNADEVEGALTVASWQMERTGLPYALVMHKGSVEQADLNSRWRPAARPAAFPADGFCTGEAVISRREALAAVIENTPVEDTWSLRPPATPGGSCSPLPTGRTSCTWWGRWAVRLPSASVCRWPCPASASWWWMGMAPR